MAKSSIESLLENYYSRIDGSESAAAYHNRHGTESQLIQTTFTDERAGSIAWWLRDRIAGKVVVEIGSGIGLLAMYMAEYASKVYAIEVDPAWSACFVWQLYRQKPKNLTFIFGSADEAPYIASDVAVFATMSGRPAMYRAASRFSGTVIDIYAELLKDLPTYRDREWAMGDRSSLDLEKLERLASVERMEGNNGK